MGGQCQHLQVEALRQQLAQWEGNAAWQTALENACPQDRRPVVSSGCPALDRILPENGFRSGTLVEWLSCGPGDGAATLAFRTAVEALHASTASRGRPVPDGRVVVVLDPSGEFYPPAAIAQGIDPPRLIVVHPGNQADHLWALDQALRCPAVAAVVAWPDGAIKSVRLNGKLDGRAFRRLQLAVEQGSGLGLLVRPAALRGEPSWADVRLLVEPLPCAQMGTVPYVARRLRIVLLRCRGGRGERTIEVEMDDEPHPLHQT